MKIAVFKVGRSRVGKSLINKFCLTNFSEPNGKIFRPTTFTVLYIRYIPTYGTYLHTVHTYIRIYCIYEFITNFYWSFDFSFSKMLIMPFKVTKVKNSKKWNLNAKKWNERETFHCEEKDQKKKIRKKRSEKDQIFLKRSNLFSSTCNFLNFAL